MITKQDLEEAIAECKGVIKPNANTCLKLASFFTIYDHMYKEETEENDQMFDQSYSFDNGNLINMDSNSEFASVVNGKSIAPVFGVIDELMETIFVLNPKLYKSVIDKLQGVD